MHVHPCSRSCTFTHVLTLMHVLMLMLMLMFMRMFMHALMHMLMHMHTLMHTFMHKRSARVATSRECCRPHGLELHTKMSPSAHSMGEHYLFKLGTTSIFRDLLPLQVHRPVVQHVGASAVPPAQ